MSYAKAVDSAEMGCVRAEQKVKAQDDPDLVVLETDDILFKEPGFRYDGDQPARGTLLQEGQEGDLCRQS